MSYRKFLLLFSLLFFCGYLNAQTTLTATPAEISDIILNPGKGWQIYENQFWRKPTYTPTPGVNPFFSGFPDSYWNYVTTGYARYHWCDIEPAEGVYNWGLIDSAIVVCAAKGKKFAFGVMNYNPFPYTAADGGIVTYTTPKWVFDAGAKSYMSVEQPTQFVPVWDDSIYLAKVQNFLYVLAARYDGNPNIAFIDIRSYGDYGECQQDHCGGDLLSREGFKKHIQIHLNAFKKTKLNVSYWYPANNPVYDWAIQQKNIGIRKDSGPDTYTYCPNGFGYAAAYGEYASNWTTSTTDASMTNWITEGKLNYTSLGTSKSGGQNFLNNKPVLAGELANKMGYHFVLKKVSYPSDLGIGNSRTIQLSWLNKGVTFMYDPCVVMVALLDSNNVVQAKQILTNSNPSNWSPNVEITETNSFSFSSSSRGTKLAIGLFSDTKLNNPDIKLGIAGRIASGWYVLDGTAQAGIPVTGLSIDQAAIGLRSGEKQQLVAVLSPSNATNREIRWTSSEPLIASVSPTGILTGHSDGTCWVSAQSVDGNFKDSIAVTVNLDFDITSEPGVVTAQGSSTLSVKENAFDDNNNRKWLDFATANPGTRASWIQFTAANSQKYVVKKYTVVSGDDAPARDPKNWEFLGSNDGVSWSLLDTKSNESFNSRKLKKEYPLANTTGYVFYRFNILSVNDPATANAVQLSELEFLGRPENSSVISAAGIIPSETELALLNGDSYQLRPTILPENATLKQVLWSASNSTLVKVNASGLVTALGCGTGTVTARTLDGGFSANTLVTVTAPVKSVSLNTGNVSLYTNKTYQLVANLMPYNACNQGIVWVSANPSVATVSNAGLVTGVSLGTTTISVTTLDGNKTASVLITVTEFVPVSGVAINSTALVGVNASRQLSASTLPGNATNPVLSWSSGDASIATVNSSGVVTGVASGTVAIVATSVDGNKVGTCRVTVANTDVQTSSTTWQRFSIPTQTGVFQADYDVVANTTVTDALVGFQNGTTNNLTSLATIVRLSGTTFTARNGSSYPSSTINYVVGTAYHVRILVNVSSRKYNIYITPPGQSEITLGTDFSFRTEQANVTQLTHWAIVASAGTHTVRNMTITVPVTGISLTPSSVGLTLGSTQQLTATIAPTNASNQGVSWLSDNPAVASVSTSGLVTANGCGTAQLYAFTEEGNKVAGTTITVTQPVTVISLSNSATIFTVAGSTEQLTPTLTPANACDPLVTWASSQSAIASVSSTGLVTAIANGTAIITASSGSVSTTYSAIVAIPTIANASRCGAGSLTLSATVPAELSVKWYTSATGGALLATSSSYSPTVSSTTTFYVAVSNGSLESSQRVAIIATVNPIPTVSAGDVNRTNAGSVNLTATGTDATEFQWFNTLSEATPFATGSSINTVSLDQTKTYYVLAKNTTTGCESSRLAVKAIINYSVLTSQLPDKNSSDAIYELGMRFRPLVNGKIKSIRYFRLNGDNAYHTGKIWRVSTNTTLSVTGEIPNTASTPSVANGWINVGTVAAPIWGIWEQINLSNPLSVTANVDYIVSVNAGKPYPYKANGMDNAITNGKIRSVAGTATIKNGVYYSYGANFTYSSTTTPVYPNNSYNNNNYFRDVIFETDACTTCPNARLSASVDFSKETVENSEIVVYPNPGNGREINVSGILEDTPIEMINLLGQKVLINTKYDNNQHIIISPQSPLMDGLYILKLKYRNQQITRKIVIGNQ